MKGDPSCLKCNGRGYIFYPSKESCIVKGCNCLPECPECHGEGRVRIRKGTYSFVKECGCREFKRRMEYLNRAGIPALYHSREISNFSPDSETQGMAQGRARAFLHEFPAEKRGLLFMGNVGSGKTHLATSLLKLLIMEKGVTGIFKDFRLLLQEIKMGYDENIFESVVLHPLWSTEVLVIDDLGKGRNTDWEISILDDIISRRYNSALITICATNYFDSSTLKGMRGEIEKYCMDRTSPLRKRYSGEEEVYPFRDTLEEKVGDRIYSRLREMCDFIPVIGVDRRRESPSSS